MTRTRTLGGAFLAGVWILALGWVLAFQPDSLVWFVCLNVYVATVLYAFNMWTTGAPHSTAAILLAVFLTPLAAVLFILRWADGIRPKERGRT